MSFDVSTFWEALFSWPFLRGALLTLGLTVAAHMTAILIALPLAVVLNGPPSILRKLITAYVGFFRAVPTLLQLLFVWNALPQIFPIFREEWFTPFLAAWIALSLNESAYQVEINRSALSAVDNGQMAAGQAIGLKKSHIYRYIMMPQALRVALPPTMNEFITLLKLTSLASIISLQELMTVTQINVARTFQFSEYYAVALTWYLVMVYCLMGLQKLVERRFRWSSRTEAAVLAETRRSRGW
ncbi:amino acid ABC transporter permease [Pseudomonas sp. GX19020]|uniref:amino acid ABC transporter permease n=1 Tax=Pseudomonadota TaxID=1224 RepID=UPI0008946CC0|nr:MULTISPECIES: amino acid ABC transporter permease [Pseudomonadota]MCL4068972.1 amino acid ABC transporter permease [Pseudomonas sp. GX19020]SEC28748.1 amino acid ABC transporter membrane protein, PAAT family [Rhodobacter sp. 24-YEA-8]